MYLKLFKRKIKFAFTFVISFFLMCGVIRGQYCDMNGTGQLVGAGFDRVICQSQSVSLGEAGNGCFDVSWESTPNDESLDDQMNDPQPTVSPNESTVYTLTVTNLANGEECISRVRIVVVENISIETIDEDFDIMNDLEVMEGREISFLVTVDAIVPAGFDILSNPIPFKFEYEYDNTGEWAVLELLLTDISNGVIKKRFDHVAENVPDFDNDHYHELSVRASIGVQDNFYCEDPNALIEDIIVYELWIDYVKDSGTDQEWKVVVGDEVEYKAIASIDCNSWIWDFPDGPIDNEKAWNIAPESGGVFGRSTEPGDNGAPFLIPCSDLTENNTLRAQNEWFGDTYGDVKVYCIDGEGRELSENSDVKVFYNKNSDMFCNAPSFDHPALWFIYWKDALFPGVPDVNYTPTDLYYGKTYAAEPHAIDISDWYNTNLATPINHQVDLNIYFGVPIADTYPRPTADGKSKIDLFYTVLYHELTHRIEYPLEGETPDSDGDFLPDANDEYPFMINGAMYIEYDPPYSPSNTSWLGDWEWNARETEDVIAGDWLDWSKEGEQWDF